MTTLVIGVAVAGLLATALIAIGRMYARARGRAPRPIASTRIQLYRAGTQDRFIGLVTGDLRRVRCAEVWVNSENTTMQMARFDEFSVSSIIRYQGSRRDVAGRVIDDRIASELADRVAGRHQVPAGTAIVTSSGELRRNGVRYIVHVAAVQGEPGAGYRQIQEVGRCVTNALTEIDRLPAQPPIRSVLFPLLGTGQGGGKLRPTIDTLVGAAVDYFATVPATHVATVFFLAYTDVEFRACVAAFRALGLPRAISSAPHSSGTRPSTMDTGQPSLPSGKRLQMGIVIDVVEFGRRNAPDREAVQSRLSSLARQALLEARVDLDTVDHQWTGDGLAVVLPTDIDPPQVLSDLLRATHRRLAEDNRTYRDRIRLRMAVGVGLVGVGATGFAGSMIVDINRLIDSPPLRDAVREHPETDLALVVSDHIHAHVVRPGYLDLSAGEFWRVDVVVKEFHEPAWVWVAPRT